MKVKRFYCPVEDCNKSFRTEERLLNHQTSHTTQSLEENKHLFECDICSTKFQTKRSLSAHKKAHRSDRICQVSIKFLKLLTGRLGSFLQIDDSCSDSSLNPEELVLPSIGNPQEFTLPLIKEKFTSFS